MTEIPFYLTIVDGESGLQTKSFLLDVDCKPETLEIIQEALSALKQSITVLPGYSSTDFLHNRCYLMNETYSYHVKNIFKPEVNFIASLSKTVEAAMRVYLFKYIQNRGHEHLWLNLNVSEYQVFDAVPLEFVFDPINDHGPIPSVRWIHSSLYKPTCFSCQMGVRELMHAIDFCKGKIASDSARFNDANNMVITDGYDEPAIEFKGTNGLIYLKPSDDLHNEFVNWFTSSFQGTLETAHIRMIEFITPWRTISRNLNY